MAQEAKHIEDGTLKEKLETYTIPFTDDMWQRFETKLNETEVQKPLTLPKLNKLWLIVPVALVAIAAGAYYFYEHPLQFSGNTNENSLEQVSGNVTGSAAETERATQRNGRPLIDSIIDALNKKNNTSLKPADTTVVVQSASLQAAPAIDTVEALPTASTKKEPLNSKVAEETKTSTTPPAKQENTHHKKKKKKNKGTKDSIESLRSRTLEPNSGDDDVVVPN